MASRGNKPLKKKEGIATPATLHCLCCNNSCDSNDFYDSDSELYAAIGKVPYCRKCINEFYQSYLEEYEKLEYQNPDRKAVERICMALDLYYNDKVFDSAVKDFQKRSDGTFIASYFKQVKLYQYRNKDYNTTIHNKFKIMKDNNVLSSIYTEQDIDQSENIIVAEKLFGSGFTNDDYIFLYVH